MRRNTRAVERARRRHFRSTSIEMHLNLSPVGLMLAASMPPDPWQRRLLLDGSGNSTAGDLYVLTSRQAGKSTSAAALAAWLAWQRSKFMVMVISPSLRQSVELGGKVGGFLHHVPLRRVRDADTNIELENGSRVVCLPGNPDTVRGYSPDLIVADEAAWISDALHEALSPARARTGGRLIALSTPGAPEGWFHTGWTSAEAAVSRIRVPWTDVPALTAEVVEAERALMPAARWRAEFECEFLAPAGQVFNVDLLRPAEDAELPEFVRELSAV